MRARERMLKALLTKQNVYGSVTIVIATVIGLAFRSRGLREFGFSVFYTYLDAALLGFGIFLVSMISGWLIFPLMIWGTRKLDREQVLEDGNKMGVYVLIYTVIAATLVFEDVVGR